MFWMKKPALFATGHVSLSASADKVTDRSATQDGSGSAEVVNGKPVPYWNEFWREEEKM